VHTFQVDVPAPAMMHDLLITDRHAIFFDMRLEFVLENLVNGKDPWVHRLDLPARFGVMPRHARSQDELHWIDVAPCGVFHFANAWVEGARGDELVVVVVGCRIPEVRLNPSPRGDGPAERGRMFEWRLDLAKRRCVSERPLSAHECDFPQVDPARVGRKARYVYASRFLSGASQLPRPEYADALFLIDGLVKFDLETGRTAEVAYATRDGRRAFGTEAVFVRSTSRDPASAADEDAGYLVTVVQPDEMSGWGSAEAIVLSAKTLEVVARVDLKRRVPYGFHAMWNEVVV